MALLEQPRARLNRLLGRRDGPPARASLPPAPPTLQGPVLAAPTARLSPTVAVPLAPPDAPRANVGETGYAATSGSWWTQLGEETHPDLVWPHTSATFRRMARTDAQCKSVLRAVTLPVRRTRWEIDPNGADDDVVAHVADDLGLPVRGWGDDRLPASRRRGRFSWAKHLEEALLMLVYGHSYFEQVYVIAPDGRAHLRKLGLRPATTLSAINVADDGGLRSIEQDRLGADVGDRNPIPVSRLVGYVNEQVGGDWRGESLLRPAYKHWLLKDRLLRVQTETIERNGMGVPGYIGADGEENLDAGRKLAMAYRAGALGGSAIPHGAELTLHGVKGNLPDAQPAIEYHDQQIGRSALTHFLNLGTQTGSWALGSTFADFFTLSLQTLGESVRDVGTQHVVEDLVDVNYGASVRAPKIVFEEIGSRQLATAQAIGLLVQQGILTADDRLEQSVRSTYGLPDQVATGAPRPAPSPAPPPGAAPGRGGA